MPFNNHNSTNNHNNKQNIQSPTINTQTSSIAAKTASSITTASLVNNQIINIKNENNNDDFQATFPNISSNYISSNNANSYYSEDANKAFDDVVFDILKVDPDHIAGQLTLIDIPLFKLIEPDELISCKWMSREKLFKAPNIVQFTRRFNQTAFWCQKEILNCKRIETRGKMLTHFIKIAKRLNELHSFNSLMAIIVALKSAPIYRLKKTWSQHVPKRDLTYFERMADIMFDTSDNKRKIRDMHMNCKLPCIPFLGLFLTDLIHIDIAHPHNAFDNPQRRNQMNNICRLISEYQQSNYQDLTSLSCSCCFGTNNSTNQLSLNNRNSDDFTNCITQNCGCDIHHGHGYGGGIINNDSTIYISEISYVKNYLNSFLYIEELQKFKEDDNYRESLELEPDPVPPNSHNNSSNNTDISNSNKLSDSMTPSNHFITSSPCKLNNNNAKFGINDSNSKNSNLINETKDLINDLKLKHPLDDSIVERTNSGLPQIITTSILPPPGTNNNTLAQNSINSNLTGSKSNLDLINDMTHYKAATTNKLNDPSLLKAVLKQRHQNSNGSVLTSNSSKINDHENNGTLKISSLKHKFNCYSSSNADDDDDDFETKNNVNNLNDISIDEQSELSFTNHEKQTPKLCNLSFESAIGPFTTSSTKTKMNSNSAKVKASRSVSINTNNNNNNNDNNSSRRLSGRNLIKSLNEEKLDNTDRVDSGPTAITPNLSNSDLFRSSLIGENNSNNHRDESNRTNNTDLSSLSSILGFEQQHLKLVLFESPVKRKCIIKNFRKPRFSQWKPYWLQLIGGNLLVYYPTKSVISFNGLSNNQRRNSTTSNQSYFMVDQFQIDSEIKSVDIVSTNSADQQQKQEKLQQLQNQLKHQKILFNKNPCKMHPIASWMVVNLFSDKENEIMTQINQDANNATNLNSSQKYNKFDIQLNDLNNGNMYKYRFDSLQLAKEWFEQFKLASTFHERQKPDNLIRFD